MATDILTFIRNGRTQVRALLGQAPEPPTGSVRGHQRIPQVSLMFLRGAVLCSRYLADFQGRGPVAALAIQARGAPWFFVGRESLVYSAIRENAFVCITRGEFCPQLSNLRIPETVGTEGTL